MIPRNSGNKAIASLSALAFVLVLVEALIGMLADMSDSTTRSIAAGLGVVYYATLGIALGRLAKGKIKNVGYSGTPAILLFVGAGVNAFGRQSLGEPLAASVSIFLACIASAIIVHSTMKGPETDEQDDAFPPDPADNPFVKWTNLAYLLACIVGAALVGATVHYGVYVWQTCLWVTTLLFTTGALLLRDKYQMWKTREMDRGRKFPYFIDPPHPTMGAPWRILASVGPLVLLTGLLFCLPFTQRAALLEPEIRQITESDAGAKLELQSMDFSGINTLEAHKIVYHYASESGNSYDAYVVHKGLPWLTRANPFIDVYPCAVQYYLLDSSRYTFVGIAEDKSQVTKLEDRSFELMKMGWEA